jgi:hypothetical protein
MRSSAASHFWSLHPRAPFLADFAPESLYFSHCQAEEERKQEKKKKKKKKDYCCELGFQQLEVCLLEESMLL